MLKETVQMPSMSKRIHGLALAAALIIVPSGAAASSLPPQQGQPANAWLTLSMLTPSGASALSAAGVAAAQPSDYAPPPPAQSRGMGMPPLPVIAIWLGVIALDVYLLTKDDDHHRAKPNSPA
jgi:hypothetical protein